MREMAQVAPGVSQCSAIVLPFVGALPIKKEQWTPCQEVCSFLKEDPHRLGQPLEIETKNKAGLVVQMIRSSIRRSLLLYHNLSLTMASKHIMAQSISSIEDIVPAALFRTEAEQNGEPLPTHVLPSPLAINKEAMATCNSWSTFVPVTESTVQRIIGQRDQLDNGCYRLPSLRHGADHRIHG